MDGSSPVIPTWLRTSAYYLCLFGSIVGGVLLSLGHSEAGAVVASIVGVVAGAFGVAYNPSRSSVPAGE